MSGSNCKWFDEGLYAVLSHLCMGGAFVAVKNGRKELDFWCRLSWWKLISARHRLVTIRAHDSKLCKNIGDVLHVIDKWENDCREYLDAISWTLYSGQCVFEVKPSFTNDSESSDYKIASEMFNCE